MVTTEPMLDYQLVRALHEGSQALPGDIRALGRYLRMIGTLLQEKATELEPSWDQACAMAAEIETLQALEIAVAERAIAVPAHSIETVRGKLAIWKALGPDADDNPQSVRNRLILSVDADLERLSRTAVCSVELSQPA